MATIPPRALHESPELHCHYCGARESLPVDAAELHRHLRLRLLQLSRAREQLEAPLRTFKAMNETWPIAIAVAGLMGAFQSARFFAGLGDDGGVAYGQALLGVLPLAVAFGLFSGWLGMRWVFAEKLRPLLRARAPQQAGLATRCRNCGGDLPSVRAPEVSCSYCGATNFLDATLTTQAAALLAAEALAYQQQALPWSRDQGVYLAPSRAFYRYAILGTACALALGSVLLFVLI